MNAKRVFLPALLIFGGVVIAGAGLGGPPLPDSAEQPSEQEKASLAYLHRQVVEIFIDRPGFGKGRMFFVRVPEDIVKAPKSLTEQAADTAERPAEQRRPETEKAKKPSHFSVSLLPKSGFVGQFPAANKKEEWSLRGVLLIGVAKHPEPVVYLAGQVPGETADQQEGPQAVKKEGPKPPAKGEAKATPKEVPTRKPDAFEAEAIKAILGGGGPQAEWRDREMRAVAGIYAGQQCLNCHEQKGQLLGAFAYRLVRVPIGEKNGDAVPVRP